MTSTKIIIYIHINTKIKKKFKNSLTVIVIQCDSRMAPQHPKNAIINITEPITINTTGTATIFQSRNTL